MALVRCPGDVPVAAPPPIKLADFLKVIRLQSTNAPASVDEEVEEEESSMSEEDMIKALEWMAMTFQLKGYDPAYKPQTEPTSKEPLVHIYQQIISRADVMPDDILTCLGAKNIDELRRHAALLTVERVHNGKSEALVMENLTKCAAKLFDAKMNERPSFHYPRPQIYRETNKGRTHTILEQQELDLDGNNLSKQTKAPTGHYLRYVVWRKESDKPDAQSLAWAWSIMPRTTNVGIVVDVARTLECENPNIKYIIESGGRPTLVSFEDDPHNNPRDRLQYLICTFQLPSNEEVKEHYMDKEVMCAAYPEVKAHFETPPPDPAEPSEESRAYEPSVREEHRELLHEMLTTRSQAWDVDFVLHQLSRVGFVPKVDQAAPSKNAQGKDCMRCVFVQPTGAVTDEIDIPLDAYRALYDE